MNDKIQSRSKGRSEVREYHTLSSGLFFLYKKPLYSLQSRFQKIEVVENDYFGKILLLDGLVQTTEKDEFFYHEMLVHPPFMVHPLPRRVLIIGGGDGGGLKEVLRYPVEEVHFVEIDPKVIEVSKKYFPWLTPCLKDERVNLSIMDGKKFIRKKTKKFDVVIIDSSDSVGPSVSLHQEAFYRDLKECLDPQGIVIAQVGSPFYHLETVAQEYAMFKDIFNTASVYLAPVPTYPGGCWCYAFLSERMDPLDVKRKPPSGLKYFDLDVYRAAFRLPPYIKDRLKQESMT